MTTHWSVVFLAALVGAVAREVGTGLLMLADHIDPPTPQVCDDCEEVYVPEAWSVSW